VGFKVCYKTKFVRASEMDVTTGVEDFIQQSEEAEEEDKADRPWYSRIIA
jgi:amino acid permease